VTETANANNADILALGSSTVLLERRVYSHTAAEHRGGDGAGDASGDRHNEATRDTREVGVATPRLAIGKFAVVGADHALGAVGLAVSITLLAVLARAALSTNANTVADLDLRKRLSINLIEA
jgi:hypothetical protein